MKKGFFSFLITILLIFFIFISACAPVNVNGESETGTMNTPVGIETTSATTGQNEEKTRDDNSITLSGLALSIGLMQLEKGGLALTKEQAESMLPLWQKYQTLTGGMDPGQQANDNTQGPNRNQPQGTPPAKPQADDNPPAQEGQNNNRQDDTQRDDLIKQAQALLTGEQIKAISDMEIDAENMQSILKDLGITNANGPQGMGDGQGPQDGKPDNAGGQQPPTMNDNQNQAGPGIGQKREGGQMPGSGMVSPQIVQALIKLLADKAGITLPTASAPSQEKPPQTNGASGDNNSPTTNTVAVYKQSGGTVTKNNQTIHATNTDQSGVNVTDGGTLVLTSSIITSSGNTSNNDQSSFYGLNAAVLADSASQITLTDTNISTTGSGANGAFATGKGSKITLFNGKIVASGDGGHGVMATQGGEIVMTNVNMDTTGANGAPYATDRGGGTITATGGTVTSSGQDSPGIYSTGTINVTDAVITSNGAEAAVIEGANTINLSNTQLTSTKDDKWGVMIYQSMSGDAEGARGVFNMTGGSLYLKAENGPLFYITNTTGVISLKDVKVTAGSGILINAASGKWGEKGSNGGTVEFTADSETLTGNIMADSNSKIYLALQNRSTLNGAVNSDHQAARMDLELDATSQWELTADSYLDVLGDADGISGSSITNITGNGFTIYYDANQTDNEYLGGKTYSLVNGGQLTPKK